jgi:hypothetical protein
MTLKHGIHFWLIGAAVIFLYIKTQLKLLQMHNVKTNFDYFRVLSSWLMII